MITDKMVEQALRYLTDPQQEASKARAAAEHMDDLTKTVLSKLMLDWSEDQRTHLMMYEDTSEGTPISPAFKTPEELARWLADNNASAFGDGTASYEAWLRVCRGGFAPSMVISSAGIQSGVQAALGDGDA